MLLQNFRTIHIFLYAPMSMYSRRDSLIDRMNHSSWTVPVGHFGTRSVVDEVKDQPRVTGGPSCATIRAAQLWNARPSAMRRRCRELTAELEPFVLPVPFVDPENVDPISPHLIWLNVTCVSG